MTLTESPHATAIRSRAEQEISAVLSATGDTMTGRDLAFDILGVLTAAAGPLSVDDIAVMLDANRRNIRDFLARARSIEPAGSPREERYSFAHQTLLEYCTVHPDIGGVHAYMDKICAWARAWQDRGWPNTYDAAFSTPTYLLDSYPAALARSRNRSAPAMLADLVADQRWVDTALTRAGPQLVLAAVRSAIDLNKDQASLGALLRAVERQAQMRGRSDRSPGWTQTSLAWDALARGQESARAETAHSLRRHHPPYLTPLWISATGDDLAASRPSVQGAIRTLAVTSDGKLVSGGGIDGALLLWNPAIQGEPAREIGRHDGVVLAASATQDGLIASGGLDGSIRIWDPAAGPGAPARHLGRCRNRIRVLAVTPDRMIVSGTHDGEIWIWNPAGHGPAGRIMGRHDGQVRGIGITADGEIVTGSTDGSVRLWDPRGTGRPDRVIGRYEPIMGLTVLSGCYVASAGLSGRVCLWDLRRPVRGYAEMMPDRPARSITATPDGHIVFGCSDGSLGIWDPAVTGNRGLVLGSHVGAIGAVTMGPGNRVFAATGPIITLFAMTVA